MSFLLIGALMFLGGILIPAGVVLGIVLGFRFLLWWLDRVLDTSDHDSESS